MGPSVINKKNIKEYSSNTTEEKEQEPCEDFTEWELIRRSMPKNLILNIIITLFTFIVLVIGTITQFHSILIVTLFAILSNFATKAWTGLQNFISKLLGAHPRNRRRQFTNKLGTPSLKVKTPTLPPFEQNPLRRPKHVNPIAEIHLKQPDGTAAFNKKVKKTYKIDRFLRT